MEAIEPNTLNAIYKVIDKQNALIENMQEQIKEIKMGVQELPERLSTKTRMSTKQFADYVGVKSQNTIYNRREKGWYEIPEGYTEPCYFQNPNGDYEWDAKLAEKYSSINKLKM